MKRKIAIVAALLSIFILTACEDTVESTENYVGNWKLDYKKTEENLQQYNSLQEMFGTGLGSYGSGITMQEDGTFSYYIGIGVGAEGQYEVEGRTITAQVVSYMEEEEQTLILTTEQEEDTQYILFDYDNEVLYWVKDN